MNTRHRRNQRGACLLELLLAILIVIGVALFVITFGIALYNKLKAYIDARNERIRREIEGDEREEPVTFYRHEGPFVA